MIGNIQFTKHLFFILYLICFYSFSQDLNTVINALSKSYNNIELLRSINSISITYQVSSGIRKLGTSKIEIKYPNLIRSTYISSDGVSTIITVFDGFKAYRISGIDTTWITDEKELKEITESNYLNEYINFNELNLKYKYLGQRYINDLKKDCHLIQRVIQDSKFYYVDYIDSKSYRIIQRIYSNGTNAQFSDYRLFNGIEYPALIRISSADGSLTYNTIELSFTSGPKEPIKRIVQEIAVTKDNSDLNRSLDKGPEYLNKKLALVIGNSAYQHGGYLKNPINDARSMSKILRDLGFEVILIENASLIELKKAIDTFGKKLSDFGVGLFYYAGHGIQYRGANYLIPVDANLTSEQQVDYDCIQVDRVLAYMDISGSKVNIIILDACRNNPFERSWKRSIDGMGLAFMNAPSGTFIAYATSPGKTADDGSGQNGLYTESLIKHLTTPNLTIEQIFKRVRNDVEQKSGNKQTPWESTSLKGEFYFLRKE